MSSQGMPSQELNGKRRPCNNSSGSQRSVLDSQPPLKKRRAKKPVDAPTRPKSAYMFFLSDFRAKYKEENPEVRLVAKIALAAGEAWRALSAQDRQQFEEKSMLSKAEYAEKMREYLKEKPRPPRKKPEKPPGHVDRPMSAYFIFLAEFRRAHKEKHGPASVLEVGRAAGEKWRRMSAAEKAPFEASSLQSSRTYRKRREEQQQQSLSESQLQPSRSQQELQLDLGLDQGDTPPKLDDARGQAHSHSEEILACCQPLTFPQASPMESVPLPAERNNWLSAAGFREVLLTSPATESSFSHP